MIFSKKEPQTFSLRKSKAIFSEGVVRYRKTRKRLSDEEIRTFEKVLDSLENALHQKDQEKASLYAHEVKEFLKDHARKTGFDHVKEFVIALVLAIIVAA